MLKRFLIVATLLFSTGAAAQTRWQMAIGAPETTHLGQIVKNFKELV